MPATSANLRSSISMIAIRFAAPLAVERGAGQRRTTVAAATDAGSGVEPSYLGVSANIFCRSHCTGLRIIPACRPE